MKMTMKRCMALLFKCSTMGMFVSGALAAEVTLRWSFAASNVDGTPLIDLAGAKVYYGTTSSNYTQIVDVPGGLPGQASTITVTGLVAGVTYYFNGTAYNKTGLESDFCAQVAKTAVDSMAKAVPLAMRALPMELVP